MALSKKAKNNLLAALVGGIIIIEGAGIYNLNNEVKDLKADNIKLEKVIDQKDTDINSKDKHIKNLDKENKDIKESNKKLKDEKESLEEKLQAKIEKESAEVQQAKARTSERPTSNARTVSNNSSKKGTPVTMTLSFYGDGDDENGGYGGITAYGEPLRAGIVASNAHPKGTQFELNGQVYTVGDRGGASHFDNPNRLDVFVPRHPGEDDASYDRRISNLGKQTVTMYKL